MLKVARLSVLALALLLVTLFGCIYCLVRFGHRNHVYLFSRIFARFAPLLGLKVITRVPESIASLGPAVYIANHQNNYDLFTMPATLQPGTVTIGKKSLKWIPLFGQIYWAAGNILIDRENRSRAVGTINEVVDRIKRKQLSIWMFPEGTRSRGRGLIPFKTGAFYTAIEAGVPIVPVVVSDTHDQVDLNRLDNGEVIVEMLEPISTEGMGKQDVRHLTKECYRLMQAKLEELNGQVRRPGLPVAVSGGEGASTSKDPSGTSK